MLDRTRESRAFTPDAKLLGEVDGEDIESNWLSSDKSSFYLILHIHLPAEEVLNNDHMTSKRVQKYIAVCFSVQIVKATR
jgi:hypothetical protein